MRRRERFGGLGVWAALPCPYGRCGLSTKRTILSPFTKEYRVLAADSGIRLFLEVSLPLDERPHKSELKNFVNYL